MSGFFLLGLFGAADIGQNGRLHAGVFGLNELFKGGWIDKFFDDVSGKCYGDSAADCLRDCADAKTNVLYFRIQ